MMNAVLFPVVLIKQSSCSPLLAIYFNLWYLIISPHLGWWWLDCVFKGGKN